MGMEDLRKKQMSIVLEADDDFDELKFIKDFKVFIFNYDVHIVGTHVKTIK